MIRTSRMLVPWSLNNKPCLAALSIWLRLYPKQNTFISIHAPPPHHRPSAGIASIFDQCPIKNAPLFTIFSNFQTKSSFTAHPELS